MRSERPGSVAPEHSQHYRLHQPRAAAWPWRSGWCFRPCSRRCGQKIADVARRGRPLRPTLSADFEEKFSTLRRNILTWKKRRRSGPTRYWDCRADATWVRRATHNAPTAVTRARSRGQRPIDGYIFHDKKSETSLLPGKHGGFMTRRIRRP
jgi:hypothetical protein